MPTEPKDYAESVVEDWKRGVRNRTVPWGQMKSDIEHAIEQAVADRLTLRAETSPEALRRLVKKWREPYSRVLLVSTEPPKKEQIVAAVYKGCADELERALDSLPATHSEREARLRDALRWAIEIMPSPVVTSTIADSSTPTLICGLCFARQTEMEKEVPHLSNCRYALAIAALAETGKGESE